MDAKYQEYLCSRAWSLKKKAVHERAGGVCERCLKRPIDCVHHKTYERKYRERLADLQGLCFPCHAYIHAEIDEDPAYEDQVLIPKSHEECARCGGSGDLVGRTGAQWYCEPRSEELQFGDKKGGAACVQPTQSNIGASGTNSATTKSAPRLSGIRSGPSSTGAPTNG